MSGLVLNNRHYSFRELAGRASDLANGKAPFERSLGKFLLAWYDANDFIEIKTSGTTGSQKNIILKKAFMVQRALATGNYLNIKKNARALLCLSPEYIAGKMMIVRALVWQWHLRVISPCSNPLKSLDSGFDFCAMVPMQLHHSLDKLKLIKTLIVGGGAISNTLITEIQRLPTRIYATYGMSETASHIALKRLNPHTKNQKVTDENKKYYHSLPGISVSTDTRGCLLIDIPEISPDKIITNDLVHCVSNTAFEWLGRYDHVINSGGIKIIPEQVEAKLASLLPPCRFFVGALPDPVLGEKVVLVVEGTPSDIRPSLFKNSLPRYEIPKEIRFIPEFVETETKKIKRKETLKLLL